MSKILSKEQVEEQRLCYAIKACHLMGFSVEKTADLLEVDVSQVKMLYNFIELMVVSLMAIVVPSISTLAWYQTFGMVFAVVFMLFICVDLECGENKEEEL